VIRDVRWISDRSRRVGSSVGRPLDRFVMACLLTFLVLHPFHHLVYTQITYYRELFALVFSAAAGLYLISSRRRALLARWEVGLLGLWVVWVLAAYIADPGISLYSSDLTEASEQLSTVSPRDYVLRNTLLYCPLFLSVYLRGLSGRELTRLAAVVVVSSVGSVITSFQAIGVQTIAEAVGQSTRGGGLSYNSYVPYVTFPITCGLFVFGTSPTMRLRLVAAGAVILQVLFLLTNPSRQSVLFAFLLVFSFLALGRKHKSVLSAVLLGGLAYWGVTYTGAGEFVSSRFFSAGTLETTRWGAISTGLGYLDEVSDWVFGRGFSSVVVSGPHNNYVRVLQRMGLVGMFLTYSPFALVFARLLRLGYRPWAPDGPKPYLVWFALAAVGFTLFHSLFGYPQDDAWQAPYVWLGLAIAMIVAYRYHPNKGSL
jgi:hypothetical protein